MSGFYLSRLMFLSLLEMAELQLTSHTTPRQTDCECSDVEVSAVTSVADNLQDCSEDVESGEPDIQTLKDEVKRLVRYNGKLYRKTERVAMRLSKITKKVRDLPTSGWAFQIFRLLPKNFGCQRSVCGSLNKLEPHAENTLECNICFEEFSHER